MAFACYLGVFATGAVFLSACGERGVEEHEVAKGVERVPSADAAPAPSGAAPTEDVAGDPVELAEPGDHAWPWRVPTGWRFDPEPREMRLATYLAPDDAGEVEIAVTRFPGRVGGDLANVNRWRTQMGLDAVSAGELESVLTRLDPATGDGYVTRIDSGTRAMLAGAVYEAGEDRTWFVRATVPTEAADRLEREVFAFVRSIADAVR